MKRISFCALLLMVAFGARASWFSFGSDDTGDPDAPRMSELMEPASLLIDDATDLAADGKASEAIEKYREALTELDRIEQENPDRAKSAEFATLRNKRAYVNAAIDSMLLSQVKSNAKVVAVSDTTELEKKLAAEKAKAKEAKAKAKEAKAEVKAKAKEAKAEAREAKAEAKEAADAKESETVKKDAGGERTEGKPAAEPASPGKSELAARCKKITDDIAGGYFAAADAAIFAMLVEKPNGATPLNLKAMSEVHQGKIKDAENTLDLAILHNPNSYHAYYNMADLLLKKDPESKPSAKRYYETGRAIGGPRDERLEELLK